MVNELLCFPSRYLAKKYAKENDINMFTIVKVYNGELFDIPAYVLFVPLLKGDRKNDVERA